MLFLTTLPKFCNFEQKLIISLSYVIQQTSHVWEEKILVVEFSLNLTAASFCNLWPVQEDIWIANQHLFDTRENFKKKIDRHGKDDTDDVSHLVVEVDHVILDGDVALHVLHNSDHDNMTIQQVCEMSIFLHRANLLNQILPQEKRVNREKFNT